MGCDSSLERFQAQPKWEIPDNGGKVTPNQKIALETPAKGQVFRLRILSPGIPTVFEFGLYGE